MKRLAYGCVAFLAVFGGHTLLAQFGGRTVPTVGPEPQSGEFMLLNPNSRLSALERQTLGQPAPPLEIRGDRSPVRLPTRQPIFVVRRQAGDPGDLLQLFAMTVVGNTRRQGPAVPYEVTAYGSNSFKLTLAAPLSPGEYCLRISTLRQASCFGADR